MQGDRVGGYSNCQHVLAVKALIVSSSGAAVHQETVDTYSNAQSTTKDRGYVASSLLMGADSRKGRGSFISMEVVSQARPATSE
jgi:hypothetical protein